MDETKFDQKLDRILEKIEGLNSRVTNLQVDAANNRADASEKFSAMVFDQGKAFESRLAGLQHDFQMAMATRAEKVDKWFDDMQESFSEYKMSMESRITSVSVKVGLIVGASSVILATVLGVIIRALFSVSSAPVQ